MKKLWLRVLLLLLFLPLLFGCGTLKKLKTEIKTITVTKIDTIIQVKTDTIIKIKEVFYNDTAVIESDYATAKSYLDTVHRKIVLNLTGKNFAVPVSIDQVKESTIKKSDIEKKPVISASVIFLLIGISFILGIILTGSVLLKKYFKL